jgi:hypothetical protein
MEGGNKRNLGHTMIRMLKEIPKEEKLREKITKELESVCYTAPENMHIKWGETQAIISEEFKYHKSMSTLPEWGVAVIEIWTNKR